MHRELPQDRMEGAVEREFRYDFCHNRRRCIVEFRSVCSADAKGYSRFMGEEKATTIRNRTAYWEVR